MVPTANTHLGEGAMKVSQGFYSFVSAPGRLVVTGTCLLLCALCYVRYFQAGFAWVPPETTVGTVPSFALLLFYFGWRRRDEAALRRGENPYRSRRWSA